MFNKEIYIVRRAKLFDYFNDGVALLLGNDLSPKNFAANTYPFRQDSHFLYFIGLSMPNLACLINFKTKECILFGNDSDMDDLVWEGKKMLISEEAQKSGISDTKPFDSLQSELTNIADKNKIHILPPYSSNNLLKLALLFDVHPDEIKKFASDDLCKAVSEIRSIKGEEEIEEIETTLNKVTRTFYMNALQLAPLVENERDMVSNLYKVARNHGVDMSFQPIVTVQGQILHNHKYDQKLAHGQLLLIDSGAESPNHYATDITRTIPVSGKFTSKQKKIYEIVLHVQLSAIETLKPGMAFIDVHLDAARNIIKGLQDVGIMKGSIKKAMKAKAYELFFPHGLGHLMGLDVHDMEDLGENIVGYDDKLVKGEAEGSERLRFGKKLKAGMVVTVEPGIYFIPALIKQWQQDQKCLDYINYDALESYMDFGGIRIEDDVLITNDGNRILGNPIPKQIAKIEALMRN